MRYLICTIFLFILALPVYAASVTENFNYPDGPIGQSIFADDPAKAKTFEIENSFALATTTNAGIYYEPVATSTVYQEIKFTVTLGNREDGLCWIFESGGVNEINYCYARKVVGGDPKLWTSGGQVIETTWPQTPTGYILNYRLYPDQNLYTLKVTGGSNVFISTTTSYNTIDRIEFYTPSVSSTSQKFTFFEYYSDEMSQEPQAVVVTPHFNEIQEITFITESNALKSMLRPGECDYITAAHHSCTIGEVCPITVYYTPECRGDDIYIFDNTDGQRDTTFAHYSTTTIEYDWMDLAYPKRTSNIEDVCLQIGTATSSLQCGIDIIWSIDQDAVTGDGENLGICDTTMYNNLCQTATSSLWTKVTICTWQKLFLWGACPSESTIAYAAEVRSRWSDQFPISMVVPVWTAVSSAMAASTTPLTIDMNLDDFGPSGFSARIFDAGWFQSTWGSTWSTIRGYMGDIVYFFGGLWIVMTILGMWRTAKKQQ
jgi:hypothetical protein